MLEPAHDDARHSLIGVALVLSYCGILLVMADNLIIASDSLAVLAGGALAFISALTYSVYLIASGTIIPSIGSARFTAYGSGTACRFVIVQFLLARDLQALNLPLPVYACSATMAIFCTVLPTWRCPKTLGVLARTDRQ